MPPDMVSDTLKHEIETCGLTRYRLWQLTGVQQSTLSRFLSGQQTLSQGAIDALCDALGLHLVTPPADRRSAIVRNRERKARKGKGA